MCARDWPMDTREQRERLCTALNKVSLAVLNRSFFFNFMIVTCNGVKHSTFSCSMIHAAAAAAAFVVSLHSTQTQTFEKRNKQKSV